MIDKKYESMTEEEKLQLKERDRMDHIKWLYFIIDDKKLSLAEFAGKEKQTRLLNREIAYYQKALSKAIGFTQENEDDNFGSEELKNLYGQILNKQIVLIACKKDDVYCDQKRAEIRALEKKIKEIEAKEKTKIEDEKIPF